jgi:cytochrome c peroxidase
MVSCTLRRAVAAVLLGMMVSCERAEPVLEPIDSWARAANVPDELVRSVRQLAAARGIGPMPAPPEVRTSLVKLGEALAFDKILSGNRDISCMTCHLPAAGTGDGRSLSIGQGATGLGAQRVHPDGAFIPRNAPPLFNLSALNSMFWDGRVSRDEAGQFHTPAGPDLTPEMTREFEFGAVSALGLFPVLSREEMRAFSGNELASIADTDPQGVWRALMLRLGSIPEYRRLFTQAYPGTPFEDMSFAHASNAIAGFFLAEFNFTDTPWDRFLAGKDNALDLEQLTGAQTFMSIRCSLCHNGPAFTDNEFHNVAVAQFGPGKGNGASGLDDFGRMNVTGADADRYLFRTTPLRNVTITGPYGHDGAFFGLRDFIAHYSESDIKLRSFTVPLNEPLLQGTLLTNFEDILATRDTILNGVVLPDQIVDQLVAFMTALTDPAARTLHLRVPQRVPSGLPVDRF